VTYTVSREGRNLGTYSKEGLARQLSNGNLLPTDLVFLEKKQTWAPISELAKGDAEEIAQFAQKLKVATPLAFVTPALVAINVLVFIVMAVAGVSIMEPANAALIRWGADFGPLTTHGQWWRLLTASFVHVGLVHIAFNMWALLSGGTFTERLFGNVGFLTLYLLSAIGGNLASIAWQPFTVAAGASGAIFGVYGALLGLLLVQHKSIPQAAAVSLGKNAMVFVGYNIVYGLKGDSNIDMAAHIGGLLTGLVAGCALSFRVNPAAQSARWQRSMVVALTGLLVFFPIARKLNAGDPKQAEAYLVEANGNRLTIGKSDTIVYSGTATGEDARRLAQALTTIGLLKDRGVLVLYSRGQGGSVISLIVNEVAWQDPKMAAQFNFLGRFISMATSTPLKLRLLDTQREVKKEFVFDR
jgi:membrane associated rhomboid family serine protease